MANNFISSLTAQEIEKVLLKAKMNLTDDNISKWNAAALNSGTSTGTSATIRGYVYPEDYGAVGDGITNDLAALNSTVAAAKEKGKAIMLTSQYYYTGKLDGSGVSWYGLKGKAKLIFSGTSSAGAAFVWGGDYVHVEGIIFEFSSSTTDAGLQGCYNKTNDVKGQFFLYNKVTCKTLRSNGTGNVYGVWCQGTGIDGLYVNYNVFEDCCYAVQYNVQSNDGNSNAMTAPLGKPSKNVFIDKNICTGCNIGINTPDLFIDNVYIRDNVVKFKTMPINIAHTGYFEVSGNILEATNMKDGVIHIEDASYHGKIYNNDIKESSEGSGILIVNKPTGSNDTTDYNTCIEIFHNTIVGNKIAPTNSGINISDNSSPNVKVYDNEISYFTNGVQNNSYYAEFNRNRIHDCTKGYSIYQLCSLSNCYFKNIETPIISKHALVVKGAYFDSSFPNLLPKSTSNNEIITWKDVEYSEVKKIVTGKRVKILDLPTHTFNTNIKIIYGEQSLGQVYLYFNIDFDGTDYNITIKDELYHTLSVTFTLEIVNNALYIKNATSASYSAGKITVLIDELTVGGTKYNSSRAVTTITLQNKTEIELPTTEGEDCHIITNIEYGDIVNDTGANNTESTTSCFRSADYEDISGLKTTQKYRLALLSEIFNIITSGNVYFYDSNKTFLSASFSAHSTAFVIPSGAKYIKFRAKNESGSTISSSQLSQIKIGIQTTYESASGGSGGSESGGGSSGSTITPNVPGENDLLPCSDIVLGDINNTTGATTTDSTTSVTPNDYIDISTLATTNFYTLSALYNNESYTLSNVNVYFFNSSKTFLNSNYNTNINYFTIPSNAKYIKFRAKNSSGNTITSTVAENLTVSINIVNTIDTTKFLELDSWIFGTLNTETGVVTDSTTSIVTDYIDVSNLSKTDSFLMSVETVTMSPASAKVAFYDSSKTFLSAADSITSTAFTIPSSAKYAIFRTLNNSGATISETLKNIAKFKIEAQ